MRRIVRREGEDIDSLIQRFKTAYKRDGLGDARKRHESFEKPSNQKRQKRNRMRRKVIKAALFNQIAEKYRPL